MTNPLRVTVIGCGQVADIHIAEIQKIETAKLVAVCDLNEIMAEQASLRHGVKKYYTDVEKMLAVERPDVVHVTTPPQSHLSLGKLALEHGAHVYMEKPFAVNTAEAESLVACAEKAGKQVCVGHNYSFDAAPLEAQCLVKEGKLGEVTHVDSVFLYNLGGPFGKLLFEKPKHWIHGLPGKLFQNIVAHPLCSVLEYVTDSNPQVQAVGYRLRSERFGDARDLFNDELRVQIKGQRCTGTVLFSCHIRPVLHYLRLYGTKGTIHVDWHARTVSFEQVSSFPGAIGRLVLPFSRATQQFKHGMRNAWRFAKSDLQYNDGMNRLFREFYSAIQEGRPSPIPMSEAVRVTRVLDEIFRQAQP